MSIKLLTVLLMVLFCYGCATAGKDQFLQLKQCQARVASLENELREKDGQIESLDEDLREMEMKSYRKSSGSVSAERRSGEIPTGSATDVQKALKRAGYYQGSIDGKIGPRTMEAIRKFQRDSALNVDGKVGPKTWSLLKQYL